MQGVSINETNVSDIFKIDIQIYFFENVINTSTIFVFDIFEQ